MSFDFGLKRIGIAVGQTATNSSRPLTTINAKSGRPDAVALKRILDEWKPELAIVGQTYSSTPDTQTPRSSDQSSNRRFSRSCKAFIKLLQSQHALRVTVIDEALTTSAANRSLAEQGVKAHNRTGLRDQYAAMEILTTWMNEQ
ncbi:MAG: Holliday junction resolvase RuvX [Proteobacteria bacterium]|nr:Holliday junction resolvase RuvX [Pseudomonadota bacterium]